MLTREAAAAVLPVTSGTTSRTLSVVLSDESVDSYGTVFEVRGWRDLRPGGVPLLLSHDRDRLPVGRIDRLEKTTLAGRRVLVGHGRFAPEGASPAADEAYELTRAGILRDVSVGFQPHGTYRPTAAERQRLGMPEHGVIFTDTELLEGSLVNVPANKGATVLAVRAAAARDELYRWLLQSCGASVRRALENGGDAHFRALLRRSYVTRP